MPNRRSLLAVSLFVVTAAAGLFADDWHKEFAVTGRPELRVTSGDANVSVQPWDKSTVDVEVISENWHIGEHGFAIHDRQNGNVVELDVPTSDHGFHIDTGNHHRRIDITVRMPREANLHIRTGDGNIEIRDMKGDIVSNTGDGKQVLTNLDGALEANTGDGSMRIEGRFDKLEAKSSDGRIDATVREGSRVTEPWRLSASDGSITLRLPEKLSADLSMHTGDGSINVGVPLTMQGVMKHNHDIDGKLNGGGELISLHTGDGSIRISTSGATGGSR